MTATRGGSGTPPTGSPTRSRRATSTPQTIFGRANAYIHGVSISAELRRFDPDQVPSRERRGRLYGEIAADHLQRRELDQARHFLERSYTESPEEAPYSPLTRGVAVELVRTATGSLKTEAVALVERVGILPAA